MKLRVKLFFAFITVVLLPVFLISCAGGALAEYHMSSIEKCYDINSNSLEVIQNPLKLLNQVTRKVYNEISLMALKNPLLLEDTEYLDSLNHAIEDKYSFIIMREEEQITYAGDPEKAEMIKGRLPAFGDFNAKIDGGIYIGGTSSFLVKQQDFYDSNKQECSIFVVTNVDILVPQIKGFAIQICVAFLLIILLTGLIITFWLYRTMICPINALRIATNRMKEGDLNYSIDIKSKDEIGLLCADFEEMRLRLKELIDAKLQYEVNSKELMSNISHDLKTPLTAIKGYTEGIMDGVADTPEKRERYLKTIYNKASDMTMLVDELSLFTKLDSDTIPYNFVTINIEQYFSDCISELMLDFEVKNIDIGYFNYTNPNLCMVADPEQLKRVVNNIIGNASKYMDKKKGIINIRIKELEEYIRVEIEDNGKGIAAKDLPYIFQRFYRADASRNSAKGGSGLGLAIAKKVIEDHGGMIWARSKEGMGTSIYFTLKKEESKDE